VRRVGATVLRWCDRRVRHYNEWILQVPARLFPPERVPVFSGMQTIVAPLMSSDNYDVLWLNGIDLSALTLNCA